MALDMDEIVEQAKMLMLEHGSVSSAVFGDSDDEDDPFLMAIGFENTEEKDNFFTKVMPTITIKKNFKEVVIFTQAKMFKANKELMNEDGSFELTEDTECKDSLFFLHVKRGEDKAESRMIEVIKEPGFPCKFEDMGIEIQDISTSLFSMVIPPEHYWKKYEQDPEFKLNLDRAYECIKELYVKEVDGSIPEPSNRVLN